LTEYWWSYSIDNNPGGWYIGGAGELFPQPTHRREDKKEITKMAKMTKKQQAELEAQAVAMVEEENMLGTMTPDSVVWGLNNNGQAVYRFGAGLTEEDRTKEGFVNTVAQAREEFKAKEEAGLGQCIGCGKWTPRVKFVADICPQCLDEAKKKALAAITPVVACANCGSKNIYAGQFCDDCGGGDLVVAGGERLVCQNTTPATEKPQDSQEATEVAPSTKAPSQWTREAILALLDRSDEAVRKAVVAIYRRQTADEKASHTTNHQNGQGFNGTDATFGTSLAEQILGLGLDWKGQKRTGPSKLSEKQIASARKMIKKYVGQLVEEATSPTTPVEATPQGGTGATEKAQDSPKGFSPSNLPEDITYWAGKLNAGLAKIHHQIEVRGDAETRATIYAFAKNDIIRGHLELTWRSAQYGIQNPSPFAPSQALPFGRCPRCSKVLASTGAIRVAATVEFRNALGDVTKKVVVQGQAQVGHMTTMMICGGCMAPTDLMVNELPLGVQGGVFTLDADVQEKYQEALDQAVKLAMETRNCDDQGDPVVAPQPLLLEHPRPTHQGGTAAPRKAQEGQGDAREGITITQAPKAGRKAAAGGGHHPAYYAEMTLEEMFEVDLPCEAEGAAKSSKADRLASVAQTAEGWMSTTYGERFTR
jgi:hypothetical protein